MSDVPPSGSTSGRPVLRRSRRRAAGSLDDHRLSGERAAVLGGAGLIGSAICRFLWLSAMEVLAIDRDPDALQALRRALPNVRTEPADITRFEDGARLERTIGAFGPSHLVHAAGGPHPEGRRRRLDAAEWSEIMTVNLIAPTHLAEYLIGRLAEKRRPGSVTFITSVHARLIFGDPSYGAAKAGLEEAVRELARNAAPHNVRVNAVAPGHVSVGPNGSGVTSAPTVLGGKSIPPDSIARAVRFLTCGHCSPHTTGTTLTIDGGLSLASPWMRT